MRKYHPQGFKEVQSFILHNSAKITWEYVIPWLPYIITELEQAELTELLQWLCDYRVFINTQKFHFHLGEFEFLERVVDRFTFTEADWKLVHPFIAFAFKNLHLYQCNVKFARKALEYMPINTCEQMLYKMAAWNISDEYKLKRAYVYEAVVNLASEYHGDRVAIKQVIRNVIKRCQMLDPCKLYEELLVLVECGDIRKRMDLDMDGIVACIHQTFEKLGEEKNLSGFDSRFFHEVEAKCLNQNWLLAEKEPLEELVGYMLLFLEKNGSIMSDHYFYVISDLLTSFMRNSYKEIQRQIVRFYIQNYVNVPDFVSDQNHIGSERIFIDDPLQTAKLNWGEDGLRARAVAHILLSGMTQISASEQSNCLKWLLECLPEDDNFIHFVSTIFFSYFYFMGEELISMEAFAGLCYLWGHSDNIEQMEVTRKSICEGIERMMASDLWFTEKTYEELVLQDERYRKFFYERVIEKKVYDK